MPPSRFVLSARLIIRSSGREALRRGLPLYLTLVIGAFVVFAGNGLDAASITRLIDKSAWLRGVSITAWLIAALPVARALLHDRQVLLLKTQPVPARESLLVLTLLLGLAEAPWIVLWTRGAALPEALAASIAVPALHVLWLTRPWRAHTAALLFVTSASWLSGCAALTIPIASVSFLLGIRSAWARGPDEQPSKHPWPMWGPSSVALTVAYLATLVRAHPAVLLRCTYLCISGSLIGYLQIRNNTIVMFSLRATLAEALFVPLATLTLASIAGPLLRAERRAEWVLASTAASPARRRAAVALALGIVTGSLALPYCAVLAVGLDLGGAAAAQLTVEHLLLAASLSVVAESVARRALQDRGRDSMRLMLGMGAATAVYVASLLALDRMVALIGWSLLAGGVVSWRAARGAQRPNQSRPTAEGPHMLEISNVRKTLGAKRVLHGVDLTVGPGEVALIHGVNGAGKSTLLRVVSGLTEADAGTLRLAQAELARSSVAYKAQLGYVPDSTDAFPDLLVGEYVALVQGLRRPSVASVELPQGWLTRLGVDRCWRQPLATLSFGQRKRLYTLTALIGDPWLLIFDEPSNGLDPAGVDLVLELIVARAERAQATLCCTNDTAFAARVSGTEYWLDNGRLRARSREER